MGRIQLSFFSFALFLSLLTGVVSANDHASLAPGHEDAAEKFIEKNLKNGGVYDAEKIKAFIARLGLEKKSLEGDLYETTMLESLELEMKDFKAAKKAALKEADENKNKTVRAYTDYLIPKMQKLVELVAANKNPELWDDLVADFIMGYMPFFVPNQKRSYMVQDLHPGTVYNHFFHPYVFKKGDTSKLEANNLMVEEENKRAVGDCLRNEVPAGHYLTNDEIIALKDCSFDLSLLNPGKSALWSKMGEKEFQQIRDTRSDLFPTEDDRISFKQVKISAKGSPKIEATFTRNGKDMDVKVKLGQEVHTDNFTSLVGRMLGLNQDIMSYRKKVRLYLEDSTYEKFWAQFVNKYGQAMGQRYIEGHGGNKGDEWVDFDDVLLEVKVPEEMGIAQLNVDGWDLHNRREYRSMLLWQAWFNINDTRIDNFKTILKKGKGGELMVQHRLQDAGYALGSNLVFRKILGLARLGKGVDRYLVNLYEPSVVDWNEDKTSVNVWWNDFANQNFRFRDTTWYDMKWMARNIARIKVADLEWALKMSGMPEEVADLYKQKILNRRNEMVTAFGLEDDFEHYPVPDLASYSPNSHVKNGTVVESNFEGHHEYETNTTGIVNLIGSFTDFHFPFGNLAQQLEKNIAGLFSAATAESNTLAANIGGNLYFETPVTTSMISPGLAVTLGRTVGRNSEVPKVGGVSLPYYVKDTFAIEINFSAEIWSSIVSYLPIDFKAGLRLYKKEFQFVHHAATVKEAYFSPFKLFFAVASAKTYAAFNMEPLEVIKIADSYGFEANASVGVLNNIPLITNEISGAIGWRSASPVYFTRDQFGALHVYKEKTRESYQSVGLHLAELNLMVAKLPILGLDFTHRRFFYQAADYTFKLPAYNQDASVLDHAQREQDYKAMVAFLNNGTEGQEDLAVLARKNYQLVATGAKTKFDLGFLFYFRDKMTKGNSHASVTMADGKEHVFYRYFYEHGKQTGIPIEALPAIKDILVERGTTSKVVVEMEEENKENLVGMIRNLDYYPKRTHDQLEDYISILNDKYSEKEAQPFYRDYILPDKTDLNLYRRVYGSTRIFVNGKGLLEKIKGIRPDDMAKKARSYFTDAIFKGKNPRNIFTAFGKTVDRSVKMDRFMDSFNQLQKVALSTKNLPRTLVRSVGEFLTNINSETYGVDFLRDFLGSDNIFVMGEIYGVYRGFNDMQKAEPLAGRRFAGKSWGVYSVVPPIQKFLKSNVLNTPSLYITSDVASEDIFGDLPNGLSPMEDLSL